MKKILMIILMLFVFSSIGFSNFGNESASLNSNETSVAFAIEQNTQNLAENPADAADSPLTNLNFAILGLGVVVLILLRSRVGLYD
jgi:hypothetical protein